MAFGSAFAPEEMRVGVMEGCGGREGGTEILAIFSRKDQKKGGGNQKAAKIIHDFFFTKKNLARKQQIYCTKTIIKKW
jgi:hypothetical protein